jgi:ureidoacrylate peracid hydrolase
MRQAFTPGDFGHALYPELDVAERDLRVRKTRFSALIQGSSDLDAMLRARGIETLIVVGTATNVCCESTARDAMMLNYKVFFVSDANAYRHRRGAQLHARQPDGHVRRCAIDRRDDRLVAETAGAAE